MTKETTDAKIDEIVNSFSDLSAASIPIENLNEIKNIFQPDSPQSIMSRLRASDTEFAKKTLKTLDGMSPLAVCVVFEQIVRGSKLSVKEVFEMEYRISQAFMDHTEFYEGVRAKLVEKTNDPNWKYKKIDDVPRSEVEYFFNYPAEC